MQTRVLRVDPRTGPWPDLERLARTVRDGGLVGFPTETVYGLAVNLRDEAAVRRLSQAKGRQGDKPLTIHLHDAEALRDHVKDLPRAAAKLARRFWPGPLTLVVPNRHGRRTGFRVPDLPVTREFLRLCDCRVGGTSANASGEEPATTAEQVLALFDGVADAVIDAGPARHGRASTVVSVGEDNSVRVLREGVVPEVDVREATARLVLFVCTGNRCRSPMAAAFATDLLARRLGVHVADLLQAGYRVESAGTGTMLGAPPTREAEAAAAIYDCDIRAHRSRPITPSMIEEADEIFVMTADHRRSILEFAPDAADRVKLLDVHGRDVPDPIGQGAAVYERCAEALHKALEQRLDDL